MAKTNIPVFTQNGLLGSVQFSTANTNRDGTGTLSPSISAGVNDSLVDYIVFTTTATNAAGTLRIFINNGSVTRLFAEVVTAAITASGTVAAATYTWIPPGNVPLWLPAGYSLYFCTNNAETWSAFVMGGSY